MIITVKLEDLWLDEDSGNLSEAMKGHIIDQVKRSVWASVNKEVKRLGVSCNV